MSVVCAVSGQALEEPVFAPLTGHVYEKRVIVKHIESVGKCPLTQQELTKEDLVTIKVNKSVKPRPVTATSIPGMLSLFQNEWDAVMAETFQLKTHLDTVRKQLSHALYQHDAACRVIARLLKERDAARAQVAGLQERLAQSRPVGPGEAAEPEGEIGMTPEIIQRMTELAKSLSKTRKQKSFPNLASIAEVKKFKCTSSNPIHQSTAPGILCLDVKKDDDRRLVTGGVDQQVILFDAKEEKLAQKLLGHTKKVTSVAWHDTKDIVVSASQDMTARVWSCTDSSNWKAPWTCAHVVRKHQVEISDVSMHPLGDFFCTSSLDKSWAVHDISTGRLVRHVQDLAAGFKTMKFHPDGLILAGGQEDNVVSVWDIKDQVTVASLSGHTDEVTSLTFSNNGYYLASASKDGTVKLWDLRKPLNIQTLQIHEGPVNCVRFDATGQYLATGAKSVKIFNFESKASMSETVELSDHTGAVMGCTLSGHSKNLASVSMDRTLRLYTVG
jgi:pre-mRNA-processing factor 19